MWRGVAFAVETASRGTGLWAYVFLTGARGLGGHPAAPTVSGVLGRRCARPVLSGAVFGVTCGAALLTIPAAWSAVAGILVVGFAAAPVFPLLTLTTPERVGVGLAGRAVDVQVAASGLGTAILPPLIGVLIAYFGAAGFAASLLVLASPRLTSRG